MEKINILILSPDSPFHGIGGLSVQLRELVQGCLKNNENIYFHIIGTFMENNEWENKDNEYFHEYGKRLFYYNCYEKQRMIATHENDLLYLISEDSNYLYTALVNNILPDIILAFDFPTCNSGWMLKDFYKEKYNKNIPFIFGCSLSYGKWYSDILKFYEKKMENNVNFTIAKEFRSFMLCDALLCNSPWHQNYFPPIKKYYEIPNGVDYEIIKNYKAFSKDEIKNILISQKGFNKNLEFTDNVIRKKILYIGRLVANKGVNFLVDENSIPENCEIYFVGDENGNTSYLKPIIQNLTNTKNNFFFAGKLNGEDKFRFIKSMDCCIFPAIHEPFGIVLLESSACGIPFFYSDIPGTGHLGKFLGGYPLKLNNKNVISEIYNSLKNFKTDPDNIKNILEKVKYFNWNNIYNQYIKMFQEIIIDKTP